MQIKKTEEIKHNLPVVTVEEMIEKINKWTEEMGESFPDYFMHDNIKDNSWAFWLLGKGYIERANQIIDEILNDNKCIDQELLYEINNPFIDGEPSDECYIENYDKDVRLWAEFLVSTPFYLKKVLTFFDTNN